MNKKFFSLVVVSVLLSTMTPVQAGDPDVKCASALLSDVYSCDRAPSVGDHIELKKYVLYKETQICHGNVAVVDTVFWPYSADVTIEEDKGNCNFNIGDNNHINWNIKQKKQKR